MGLWSLPGGRVELGETVREAVQREVLEETGLVVEPVDIAGVRDVIGRENGEVIFHYIIVSFHASVVSGTLAAGSDASEVRWVPLSNLPDYDLTAGLADWLSTLGLT